MKVNLIRIGNSRGVRIPKAFLEEVGLEDRAELTVRGNTLVLQPERRRPRAGWADAIDAILAELGPETAKPLPDHVSAEADREESW
jgi:antitoxin MazE